LFIRHAVELFEESIDVAVIAGAGPRVARRVDARPAVERVDHESRVVRYGCKAGRGHGMPRFDERVLNKRAAGFIGIADIEI